MFATSAVAPIPAPSHQHDVLALTAAVTVRGAGERFYNFEGIREFTQWFYPEWSPRFLVSAGGAAHPLILANIASLIAGGLDGIVTK